MSSPYENIMNQRTEFSKELQKIGECKNR